MSLLYSARTLHVDDMEFRRYGMEDEDDEDDAATQYMIEQSLLESNKQKETVRDSTTRDSRRSVQQTPELKTFPSTAWYVLEKRQTWSKCHALPVLQI